MQLDYKVKPNKAVSTEAISGRLGWILAFTAV